MKTSAFDQPLRIINNPPTEPLRSAGFTLIEIIIALAIVSLATLAIGTAMGKNIATAAGLERRVIAAAIASNQIALLRHDAKINKIKTGTDSDTIKMGGHKWCARTQVKKTDVEHVFLVVVTVRDGFSRNEKIYATLTTAISDSF